MQNPFLLTGKLVTGVIWFFALKTIDHRSLTPAHLHVSCYLCLYKAQYIAILYNKILHTTVLRQRLKRLSELELTKSTTYLALMGELWVPFWALGSHGVSNRLVTQPFVQVDINETSIPHYWFYVRGIHRWPVDSPHKGPVMRNSFPCHDVTGFGENWSTGVHFIQIHDFLYAIFFKHLEG